jgi:NADH:ubiquinone reductase (H+-translocating)
MSRPKVVIIGGGFGGVSAARALRKADVDITLVDRNNHHLFQPLLYQVASAVLPPSDITRPIRRVLRGQKNVCVLMGEVTAVDVGRRVVHLNGGRFSHELEYDFLIVAAGIRNNYFGHDEWQDRAPGLKTVVDAEEIRRRFLMAFEEAEKAGPGVDHDDYLTFVVIGGGSTGVELAGILPSTARAAMRDDFRNVRVDEAKVILLEGGPRILSAFPESLSRAAERYLSELGVVVRTNTRVTDINEGGVWVGDEYIRARTVLWAAGMEGEPIARQLGCPLNEGGQAVVAPDLSVPSHPEVFVVGDLAAVAWKDGLVPAVAPAANQEGRHAARMILATVAGRPRSDFSYLDKGMLATIGRHRAVGSFRGFNFRGYIAWWAWLIIHIIYLAGFRNRLSVLIEWMYGYFTFERGSRLISGSQSSRRVEGGGYASPRIAEGDGAEEPRDVRPEGRRDLVARHHS